VGEAGDASAASWANFGLGSPTVAPAGQGAPAHQRRGPRERAQWCSRPAVQGCGSEVRAQGDGVACQRQQSFSRRQQFMTVSVWFSDHIDALRSGRDVTSPQSFRHDRCLETWTAPARAA